MVQSLVGGERGRRSDRPGMMLSCPCPYWGCLSPVPQVERKAEIYDALLGGRQPAEMLEAAPLLNMLRK